MEPDQDCTTRDASATQPDLLIKDQSDLYVSDSLVIEDIKLRLESHLELELTGPATVTIRRNSIHLEEEIPRIINIGRGNTSADLKLIFAGNVVTTESGLSNEIPNACALTFSNRYQSHGGGDADIKNGQSDVYVVNNTIVDTGERAICVYRSSQTTVANNIILGAPSGSIVDLDHESPSPLSVRNNIIENAADVEEVLVNVDNILSTHCSMAR